MLRLILKGADGCAEPTSNPDRCSATCRWKSGSRPTIRCERFATSDRALARLSQMFGTLYVNFGRPSIPQEKLLRALLLQALYTMVERGAIRMALGQLLDYRRFVENPECAILLPERPRQDLVALIQSAGIGLYWQEGNEFQKL